MSVNPILCSGKEYEKVISFNLDVVRTLQNRPWKELSSFLKEEFKIERHQDGTPKRLVVSEDILHCLDKWLTLTSTKLEEPYEMVIEVITDILRSLRNCVSNDSAQKYILEHTNILMTCDIIFSKIIDIDRDSLCLKILLQFLINLISSKNEAVEKIHDIFFDKIKQCLKNGIHVYESSALIYNISLSVPVRNTEIINIIFEKYNSDEQYNEFLSFFLENCISKGYFWDEYKNFQIENRIAILEILRHKQVKRESHSFPLIGLETLISTLLNSMNLIFQIEQGKGNNTMIYEVSLILEILSSLSSDEYYLENLQGNKDLFINAGVLLINVHKLGKLSDNCFTPVQKLSEFTEKSELKDHPAFGFKADLIRLIGNLCWKNIVLQDLARTSELISIILDCCNMDAKNPFIIQWAVFAVRNICENNPENQKFIASLHQKGVVSSETLGELGMTLHSDGGNDLKIVPLDSLRNNH